MYLKVCDYIALPNNASNMHKICKIIGDLCTSSSEFKNHYFKEVVGASFAASTFMKSHNPCTYRPLASELNFLLSKHTLYVSLYIGKCKFRTIIKKYGTTVKFEHRT